MPEATKSLLLKRTVNALKKSTQILTDKIGADNLFQGKTPSLWKLYEDGVSSSFLNSFLTCMEQTRLSYIEGWSSRTTPMAFEFGTCCHWVLEQAYQPNF